MVDRVLLINAAENAPAWPTMPRAVEPMGLLYVAGAFEQAGVEVTLVDLQLESGDLQAAYEEVARGRLGGVGIALSSQACLWSAAKIAQDIKNLCPPTPVFAGGVFASLNADWLLELMPAFDFVVVGEAEPFVFEFVNQGGRWEHLHAARHRARQKVDQPALPAQVLVAPRVAPDRSLTRAVIERGEAPSVVASRGCGGGCSFCCISRYYGSRWKPRDVEDVCRELEELVEHFGTRRFHLVDDNLFGHAEGARTWVASFIEALARFDPPLSVKTTCRLDDLDETLIPHLRRAGFDLLKIGLETFGQESQSVYGKRISQDTAARKLDLLRQAGVGVSLGLIMFDPYCSISDLRQNLDFLLHCPDDWSRHLLRGKLIAYRGTHIERRLQRDGLVTSASILGAEWRFRNQDVAEVHRRFEGLLRAEILESELRLYHRQKAAIRAGQTPPRLGELEHLLKASWTDLFRHALDERPRTAGVERKLRHLRACVDDFCSD